MTNSSLLKGIKAVKVTEIKKGPPKGDPATIGPVSSEPVVRRYYLVDAPRKIKKSSVGNSWGMWRKRVFATMCVLCLYWLFRFGLERYNLKKVLLDITDNLGPRKIWLSTLVIDIQSGFSWLAAFLNDPKTWDWQHWGFLVAACIAVAFWLNSIGFFNWIIVELRKFGEAWRLDGERTRRDAQLREQEFEQNREAQRKAFYERSRTPREASLELRQYQRELERIEISRFHSERQFRNLSREEIHRRIDFLETSDFKPKKQDSTFSEADRRIACRKLHDEGLEKELRALSNTFLSDAERVQEMKEIRNYWNDKKRKALQKIGGAERNENVTA